MSSVEIPLKPMKSQQLTSNCDDQTTLQKSASPMEAGVGQRITMTACARYFYSFSFLHRYDPFYCLTRPMTACARYFFSFSFFAQI